MEKEERERQYNRSFNPVSLNITRHKQYRSCCNTQSCSAIQLIFGQVHHLVVASLRIICSLKLIWPTLLNTEQSKAFFQGPITQFMHDELRMKSWEKHPAVGKEVFGIEFKNCRNNKDYLP